MKPSLIRRQALKDELRRKGTYTHGCGLPPVRKLTELADEFGVTVRHLCGKLSQSENAPAPRLCLTNKKTGCNSSWYEPNEFRRWWESVK